MSSDKITADASNVPIKSSKPEISHPQAAWPALPMAITPADMSQWAALWQAGYSPSNWDPLNMQFAAMAAFYQQQHLLAANNVLPPAAHQSTSISNQSPRSNIDDSVKLVKPREAPAGKPLVSPVGIQSPKPNSPGFLLGHNRKEGYHAFSPYSSRSETPVKSSSSSGMISQGLGLIASDPGLQTYSAPHIDIAVPKKIRGPPMLEQGIDLTVSKASTQLEALSNVPTSSVTSALSNPSTDKRDDGRKSAIPVGIAVARQRTAGELPEKTKLSSAASTSNEHSSSSGVTSSGMTVPTTSLCTTSTNQSTQQMVNTSVASPWPQYPVPFIANPYQHFGIAAPPMYMMPAPAHRPMFPGQAAAIPGAPPAYFAMPTNPSAAGQMMLPELTVKTSQQLSGSAGGSIVHASTSPSKPLSAASSPKSPLDKAREKLHEIRQRTDTSQQVSPLHQPSTKPKTTTTNKQKKSEPTGDSKSPAASSKTSSRSSMSTLNKNSSRPDQIAKTVTSDREAVSKSTSHIPETATQTTDIDNLKETSKKKGKGRQLSSSNLQPIKPKPKSPTLSAGVADISPVQKSPPKQLCSLTSETVMSYEVEDNEVDKSRKPETVTAENTYNQDKSSELKEKSPQQESIPQPMRTKGSKVRGKRRRSTASPLPVIAASVEEKPDAVIRQASIPEGIEQQPFLFAEDALDPIITKYDDTAYDICQDEDLQQLEKVLKNRLKAVNKTMKDQKSVLDKDDFQPLSKSQTPTEESSPKVSSTSNRSLLMKAAAKAKSRASQEERSKDEEPEMKPPPTKKEKLEKLKEPLIPLDIPDENPDCRKLTKAELLTVDSRILINIEGLFYESRIKPIAPPDIFGVAIDGERHSKARIFTEEDLLHNTYTNVVPQHLTQVSVGTRVCAYWSEMIGCLYPGTVTAVYPHASHTKQHLLDIEFDDGDSGKFPLVQIRILPQSYPRSHYDTSAVLPLGRRKSSVVPETPPIMISPPANRGRITTNPPAAKPSARPVGSRLNSISSETKSTVTVKRGRGRPPKSSSQADVKVKTISSSSSSSGSSSSASSSSGSSSGSDDDEESSDDEAARSVDPSQTWHWVGAPIKKQARGKGSKEYYDAITKNDEIIKVGDCAVFQSVGSNPLPYIGEILSLWEGWAGKMKVTVKWFYHPQELKVSVKLPKTKGALFKSDHSDENDVQTIVHGCQVLPYDDFIKQNESIANRTFYLAGHYDAARRKVSDLKV